VFDLYLLKLNAEVSEKYDVCFVFCVNPISALLY